MRSRLPLYLYLATLIAITATLFIRCFYYLDPDFGWHYKLGELIVKGGIQYKDPFSYTMSSYKLVDHEWLTNIFIYLVNYHLGFNILAFIFSGIIIAGLIILSVGKYFKWSMPIMLLITPGLFPSVGVRPQLITWFCIAVLIKIFLNEKVWRNYHKFLPILFLVWANLHGGFSYGLLLFSLFIIFRLVQKKLKMNEFLVFVISGLITLINPYGYKLWWDIWAEIINMQVLRSFISEWMPYYQNISLSNSFVNLSFISLSFILLSFNFRKRLWSFEVIAYFTFLAMAILSKRNMPLFLIISLPIMTSSLYQLSKRKIFNHKRLLAGLFLITAALVVFQLRILFNKIFLWQEDFSYPKGAIEFLQTRNLRGNIFSSYGWGGYLIWKYPTKKVFISGLMPSWRLKSAPVLETDFAFRDYTRMVTARTDIPTILAKYNIKVVLWPKRDEADDPSSQNIELISSNQVISKTKTPLISSLKKLGWKQVYSDYVSVIYIDPASQAI